MNVTTEQLFDDAHTQYGFLPEPIPDETLKRLYDIVKFGPTSANCCPMRIVFVRSQAAKRQLIDAVSDGNKDKVAQAPVTAVIGMDMAFYEQLPRLMPQVDARSWFAGQPAKIDETAMRNSSLQGGYFIVVARALGLGCGPMSGFDPEKMDVAFWAGTPVKTNFVCALGKGDPSKERRRNPRLAFEEACRIA